MKCLASCSKKWCINVSKGTSHLLPKRHSIIENRVNHGLNLKITNLRDQKSHGSANIPLRKNWKYADYAGSVTLLKVQTLRPFFQIMPKIRLAQSIYKPTHEQEPQNIRKATWHLALKKLLSYSLFYLQFIETTSYVFTVVTMKTKMINNRPFYTCVLSCYLKSSKVCIITRSSLASLLFKGLATKHTTVKWTIHKGFRYLQHNV